MADVEQRTSGDERKRGEDVARRIEADVIAAGWPVGAVLGSATELGDRYGVSRGILREAVRVLEYLGVARMRWGAGGGLMVTEPDPSAVFTAVVVYLTFEKARLEDVLDVRTPIEAAAARLAAQRRSAEDAERLRVRVALERERGIDDDVVLHRSIARITGNPAFELFVEILARIATVYQSPTRLSAAKRRAAIVDAVRIHERIAAAISAGDGDAAARRVVRHLDASRDFLTARQLDRRLGLADALDAGGPPSRRAPMVASRIYSEVVARGWPVGELVGSESELIVRHDVSRAVLREAIRLLEFNQVVRTRRGPGGGVLIAAPSQTATVGAMAVYLESRGITPQQLFEVRHAVEMATVDTAVATLDARGAAVLRDALEHERHAHDKRTIGHQLHIHLAEITGNRVLALFMNALTRLAELHTLTPETGLGLTVDEAAARMHRSHGAIVKAILSGDRDLARRRMERHLAALAQLQR